MTRADRAIRRIREADRHGRPTKCPVCGELLHGLTLGRMECPKVYQHGGYIARWGKWRRCNHEVSTRKEWDCQKDQWGIAEKKRVPEMAPLVVVLVTVWFGFMGFVVFLDHYSKARLTHTVSEVKPTTPTVLHTPKCWELDNGEYDSVRGLWTGGWFTVCGERITSSAPIGGRFTVTTYDSTGAVIENYQRIQRILKCEAR